MNNIKTPLIAYASAATLTFYVLTYIEARYSLIKLQETQRQSESFELTTIKHDYIKNTIKRLLLSVYFPIALVTDIIPYFAYNFNK